MTQDKPDPSTDYPPLPTASCLLLPASCLLPPASRFRKKSITKAAGAGYCASKWSRLELNHARKARFSWRYQVNSTVRQIIFWVLIIGGAFLLYQVFNGRTNSKDANLNYPALLQKAQDKQ